MTEILRTLQCSDLNGKFLFKGGTSLSKALGLINRFSEDIDLLFIDESESKNLRRKLLKKAETITASLPLIEYDRNNPDSFSSNDHKTSCFKYPAVDASGLLPYIKLEMGFRGGYEPSTVFQIQSIIANKILAKNPNQREKA